MGKVNIGLRGWRFDEAEVFDEDGDLVPLGTMDPETRDRIVRLSTMMGEPCDACYLIHGDENIQECNVARIVYGEPLGEVLLCPEHEADFLYWFREAGGKEYAGETEMEDAFYAWFDDGGRAPDGYAGIDHVDTDADDVPVPDPAEELPTLEEELEKLDDETLDDLGVDLGDLDL
ncbi:hypothetical protein [Halorientalis pallida]|uniref:Uncharacterized protein n=1 Tax=Halorientalis pallida TaxID=2479928 RepID=A0A498L4R1_9EURY|nr:hypothetical protein [Halorientalis pallida]RXK49282.1 hypothetical protein EAF64_10210 [Halorientalis pallida]